MTDLWNGSHGQTCAYRKAEGIYDPEACKGGSKKQRLWTNSETVLKLTQVGVVNNLRGSRERLLRN